MEESGELHVSATLPLGKEFLVLIGAQSRCGRCGEKKHLLSQPQIELQFLDGAARTLVTILIELSRSKQSELWFSLLHMLRSIMVGW
jgi:hypothetical protein